MSKRIKIRFEDQYPDGHKTFERWFDVAGVHHREEAVRRFADWKDQSVSMEPEPNNRHDKNAIAVYGHGIKGLIFKREASVMLGYIPKEIAQKLHQENLVDDAALHLNQIDVGDYLHVKISLSVPKPDKK